MHKDSKNYAKINEKIESIVVLPYTQVDSFVNKKEIKETKTTAYKTIFKPIMTYGGET